jgi:hypothetical protein
LYTAWLYGGQLTLLCFGLKPLKVERVDMVHQAGILQAALAIQ